MSNFNLANSRLTEQQLAQLCAKRPIRVGEGDTIMTGPVRIGFPPAIGKKAPGVNGGKEKYQATLLFPHKNLSVLMDATRSKLKAWYPKVTDVSVFLNPFDKAHPIRDQAMKVSVADGGRDAIGDTWAGFSPGFAFINPKSEKQMPKAFHAVAGRWVPVLPEEIDKVFYSGCWVDAQINIYKSNDKNPGAALGLNAVWKLADDEAFAGGGNRASAEDGGDAGDAFAAEDPNNIPMNNDPGAGDGGWG